MHRFDLDPKLQKDTLPVVDLGLCRLLLMNDARWPWTILVPKRDGLREFHDLSPLDQAMLTFETAMVSRALKDATAADKINVGALGNVVSMFHQHVVARFEGDANWPGPVWGFGQAEPYAPDEAERLASALRDRMLTQ